MPMSSADMMKAMRWNSLSSGLTGLGGGLMQAAYGNPQGIAAGLQGFQKSTDPMNAMKAQFMMAQMNQMQAEQARKQKQAEAWQGLFRSPTGGASGAGPGAGPGSEAGGLGSAGPAAGGLMSGYSPEQLAILQALGPEKGMGVLAQQAFKPAVQPKEFVNFHNPETGERKAVRAGSDMANMLTMEGWVKGDPAAPPTGFTRGEGGALSVEPAYEDFRTKMAQAGQPQITIDQRQERAQVKAEGGEVGKFYGEQYGEMQQSAVESRRQNARMNAIENLFENTYTGKFAGNLQEARKAAKALGVEGLEEAIAGGEAGEALANEYALQLRNPSGGAGMPGALSDSDRRFLQGMVGGIATSPEGRKMLFKVRRKLNERSIDIAREARDYRKKNGSLDEGFYDLLDTKYAGDPTNDLFAGVASPAAPSVPSAASPSDMSLDDIQRELLESLTP